MHTLKRYLFLAFPGSFLLLLGTFKDSLFDSLITAASDSIILHAQWFSLKVLLQIVLNTGLCLWMLLLLFRDRERRVIVLSLYIAAILLSLSFAIGVKLAGDEPQARKISRDIIDLLLLSPLPVLVLTPVLTLISLPEDKINKNSKAL